MDYYEELGLTRAASQDEIRSAYKTLVRVLHPDAQSDESTRQIADLQLRRVNNIAEVLLHPVRRHRYDLSLEFGSSASRPSVIVAPPPFPVSRFSWRSAVLLVIAGVVIGCIGQFAFEKALADYSVPVAAEKSDLSDHAAAIASSPG